MSKIKTITLGCRFNYYESEVEKAMLNSLDLSEDVVIVNTCAVTHEAERQSKQAVRKAIRENSGAKIIVTGCAAKTASEYFNNLTGVFKVIQNDEKTSFNESFTPEENDQLFKNRARVFLQIQNGCNHFCTYCIVPFTRGRSKSLTLETIMQRIRYFDNQGFKEIVLSGIDITSYGEDFDGNLELADVIEAILQNFPKQKRIRISSIDPKEINDRLFNLFAYEERIMPHFHLSIQSGDNDVLKAMRRRHSREDVINFCNKLKNIRKDVVFGADFIAGFPTETEEMFNNTLRLIDDAGLSLMHVFPFSPRTGTVASNMIQLPKSTILNRAKILRAKADGAKHKLFMSMNGKYLKNIIIEKHENGISYGKTDSFIPIIIEGEYTPGGVLNDLSVLDFNDEAIILKKENKEA